MGAPKKAPRGPRKGAQDEAEEKAQRAPRVARKGSPGGFLEGVLKEAQGGPERGPKALFGLLFVPR
jgi:hypothetical protein